MTRGPGRGWPGDCWGGGGGHPGPWGRSDPLQGARTSPVAYGSAVTSKLTTTALGPASPGCPLCLLPQGWGHLRTPEAAQEAPAEGGREGGWDPRRAGPSQSRPLEDPNLNSRGGCPVHTTSFFHPSGGPRPRWGGCPQDGPGGGGGHDPRRVQAKLGIMTPGGSRPRWGVMTPGGSRLRWGLCPQEGPGRGGGHDPRRVPAEGRQPPVQGLRLTEMRCSSSHHPWEPSLSRLGVGGDLAPRAGQEAGGLA